MNLDFIGKAAAAAALVAGLCACEAPGAHDAASRTVVSGQLANPVAEISAPLKAPARSAIINPKQKYYGLEVPGAPGSMTKFNAETALAQKKPNLLEYFEDWNNDGFDAKSVQNVCNSGMVPLLTWESWSWADTTPGQGSSWTQKAYAPKKITAGKYDTYIRTFAKSIKSLHCKIMLRFDQEPNGSWYPWGVGTKGMHTTPAAYVAMYRHVEKVFSNAGVNNVVWMWSPNYLFANGINKLKALYPGNKYVDIVGIDGYLLRRNSTPANIWGPTIKVLKKVAPSKPLIISETGAAAGPKQPEQIAALLKKVAADNELDGFVYFDQPAPRANWSFDASPASIAAFVTGIANKHFAAGH